MAETRTPNKRHDLRSRPVMVRESPLKDPVDIMKDEVLLPENLCVFSTLNRYIPDGLLMCSVAGKRDLPFR